MKHLTTNNEKLEDEFAWWVLRYINPHNNIPQNTRLSLDQHPIYHCERCDNVWNSRKIARQTDKQKKLVYIQTNYSVIPKPEKKRICRKCKNPSIEVESY